MAYLLFLNLLMLTRLGYMGVDGPASKRGRLVMVGLQLSCLLLFEPGLALLGVFASLVVSTWVNAHYEQRVVRADGLRALTFAALALVSSLCFTAIAPNPVVLRGFEHLAKASWWLAAATLDHWRTVNVLGFGLLLLTNEVNLVIRWVLFRVGLEPHEPGVQVAPGQPPPPPARQEYNAGRMIGIMERYLMYIVIVLAGNYNVLAFVLAAKGFARFKQMDERAFAEYVLIGTLMSTLATVVVALLVNALLSWPG